MRLRQWLSECIISSQVLVVAVKILLHYLFFYAGKSAKSWLLRFSWLYSFHKQILLLLDYIYFRLKTLLQILMMSCLLIIFCVYQFLIDIFDIQLNCTLVCLFKLIDFIWFLRNLLDLHIEILVQIKSINGWISVRDMMKIWRCYFILW